MRRTPAAVKICKHPAAIAQQEWEEKNYDLFRLDDLGTNSTYLRNRLLHAFMDGWDAREAQQAPGSEQ